MLTASRCDIHNKSTTKSVLQDVKSTLEDIAEGRWSREETSPRFRQQLDEIYDELSIEDRQMQPTEEEPFALTYLRYMNMDYGFLPLTKEMLPEQLIELLEKDQSRIVHSWQN